MTTRTVFLNKFRNHLSSIKESATATVDRSDFTIDRVLKDSSNVLFNAMESGVPAQAGYGFLMGYSSGYCLKKVSKVLAFGLGSVFVIMQTLSYYKYIDVNYSSIQKDMETLLDVNKDGKVDEEDAALVFDKIKSVLQYNMPSGGGFTAGLFLGLRG